MKYVISLMSFILIEFFWAVTVTAEKKECVFYTADDCIRCDYVRSFEVGHETNCTNICPNREVNNVGSGMGRVSPTVNNCALKECPRDFPLRNKYGSCYACDEDVVEEFENCESICSNRFVDSSGYCKVLKKEDKKAIPQQSVGWKRECLKDKPLKDWEGCGHDCEEQSGIWVDNRCNDEMANCDSVCPNRFVLRGWGGNPSSILRCEKDRPLMDDVGFCWPCDTKEVVYQKLIGDECEKVCKGKRYLSWFSCLKCPDNKSDLGYEACRQCGGIWQDGRCTDL